MRAQQSAVARTPAPAVEPIGDVEPSTARGGYHAPLRFGPPPTAGGPSASDRAYGATATGPTPSPGPTPTPATVMARANDAASDPSARIIDRIDCATPEAAARIVFALEDARARCGPCDARVRVDLPDSLESVEVGAVALPGLIARGEHRAGGHSSVATTGSERMAPSEVLFEQMSHYAQGHILDQTWLAAQGYELYGPAKREAPYGLTCVTFVPNGRRVGAPPLLAFYGTDMADPRDIVDDAVPQCPGYRQVMMNQGFLLDLLTQLSCYGTVAIAGHSLGGANAQLTACLFPELVASVHTYQSPGVSAEMAKRLATYNKGPRKIRSTHYHEDSDIVETVGDAWTQGEFVNYHIPGTNGPVATNLEAAMTGGVGAAGEHALAAHDGMLATRTWLDQHPEVAECHADLATSPEPRAYETGRSSTAGVHGANEGLRDAIGGNLIWSDESLMILNLTLDRIESYRADLRAGATLDHVLARVDGELILKPLGHDAIDQIKHDLTLYAAGLDRQD